MKKTMRWLIPLGLLGVIAFIFIELKSCDTSTIGFTTNNPEGQLLISPEEIRSIEDIGQWVFLNMETEEMADTVRRNLFSKDDALSRIYTGTLHYGIDMSELKGKDWFTVSGDTAQLALPAVRLLDTEFINEAKTRTFYQNGDWSGDAFKALYQKARRKMLQRCNTPKNLKAATENAEQEITLFIQSFGFKEVEIRFQD